MCVCGCVCAVFAGGAGEAASRLKASAATGGRLGRLAKNRVAVVEVVRARAGMRGGLCSRTVGGRVVARQASADGEGEGAAPASEPAAPAEPVQAASRRARENERTREQTGISERTNNERTNGRTNGRTDGRTRTQRRTRESQIRITMENNQSRA